MTPEQKAWIDNAPFAELLRRWRFPVAEEDSIFQDGAGKYYSKVMFGMRDEDPSEWTRVSKIVGWG